MKTIVLIGMMGSGKTTIGKLLGEKLTLRSIDIDVIIEQNEKEQFQKFFKMKEKNIFETLKEKQ